VVAVQSASTSPLTTLSLHDALPIYVTTSTCDGLSQWGSEALAQEGLDSVEILRFYYGDDIEIVTNAPMAGITESYPGIPLRVGRSEEHTSELQSRFDLVCRLLLEKK